MINPPSKDWREVVAPDEAERFERHGATLRALQAKRATGGATARALHAKGFGVEGELRVLPDLAPELRQGLFAEPRTYRCYVRYSNGAGLSQSDRKPDVRGVAIKVLGVPGKKVIPGLEDAPTQDFLLIRSPSLPFRDADEFVGLIRATANPLFALPRLLGLLGIGRTFSLLGALQRSLGAPFPSVATAAYHTAAPLRFGDYASKLSLLPRSKDDGAPPGQGADYLAADLHARIAKAPVVYDLTAQLYRDEASTPIEDVTAEWLEEAAPRQPIATLTLGVQEAESERGRTIAERVERMSFDPWHALEAHRPLGSVMRARNVAYRHSTEERKAAPEPDGSELGRSTAEPDIPPTP